MIDSSGSAGAVSPAEGADGDSSKRAVARSRRRRVMSGTPSPASPPPPTLLPNILTPRPPPNSRCGCVEEITASEEEEGEAGVFKYFCVCVSASRARASRTQCALTQAKYCCSGRCRCCCCCWRVFARRERVSLGGACARRGGERGERWGWGGVDGAAAARADARRGQRRRDATTTKPKNRSRKEMTAVGLQGQRSEGGRRGAHAHTGSRAGRVCGGVMVMVCVRQQA